MSNAAPPLFAAREPIFPRRVSGFFRRLKWVILILTLGVYYITPWIRWDRGPNLPDQAVLVDLANRRFHFFWTPLTTKHPQRSRSKGDLDSGRCGLLTSYGGIPSTTWR